MPRKPKEAWAVCSRLSCPDEKHTSAYRKTVREQERLTADRLQAPLLGRYRVGPVRMICCSRNSR